LRAKRGNPEFCYTSFNNFYAFFRHSRDRTTEGRFFSMLFFWIATPFATARNDGEFGFPHFLANAFIS
jgi:hypothetical protein